MGSPFERHVETKLQAGESMKQKLNKKNSWAGYKTSMLGSYFITLR